MAIEGVWHSFHSAFWRESFWLPPNVTWKDLENKDNGIYYPEVKDIYFSLFVGFVIMLIRYIFESCIAYPFGKWVGIRHHKARPVQDIKVLENSFKKNKVPSDSDIKGLAKQTDLNVRQVERWFRGRRNMDRPVQIVKFSEAFWVFTFYLSANIAGFYVLWDKTWLWETKYCWEGYPVQTVTSDVYWYYMIELGFYWSCFVNQFFDIKRKDFWEMFLHHICTISLMSFSWMNNFVRIGTLVIVVHDIVDYWMQAAKMCKYAGKQEPCNFFFGVFVLLWFLTRLVLFPVRVLYSVWYEAVEIVGPFISLYLYKLLLGTLQVLHVIWYYMILRIAYLAVVVKVQKDVRSDSEETVTEEEGDTNANMALNGKRMVKK